MGTESFEFALAIRSIVNMYIVHSCNQPLAYIDALDVACTSSVQL